MESETVSANAEKIAEQARRLFSGADFTLLNNTEWLEKLNIIEFLRDTGKHFTVNMMLQRDFIKDRIKNPEEGISYTEFSYALSQAYDYFHLHQEYGCDVQVGGSDQWGNIVSGVDFIRRKTGDVAYAFTWPLLVNKATGKKFGKSEMGTIWLSPEKTTPFQFYQFWFNTEDEAVREYLLKMTMLSETEIDAAMELHKREPRRRHAQGILAQEITSLVHGESTAEAAERVSRAIFDENLAELSPEDITNLREVAPSYEAKIDDSLIDVLVGAQLASSKREARQFLAEKAITLNGKIVKSERELVEKDFSESLAILKRGKRNVCILILV